MYNLKILLKLDMPALSFPNSPDFLTENLPGIMLVLWDEQEIPSTHLNKLLRK